MKKLLIGVAIMAMASMAQAKMPDDVKQKVDAIKARVESKVTPNGKSQQVRAAQGDKILIHDGVTVIDIKEIDPLEQMSIPATRTVFVGNDNQIKAEIKKLKLK